MPLTKANIVQSVHHNLQLPKSNSVQVVESLLEIIKRAPASGEDLRLLIFPPYFIRNKTVLFSREICEKEYTYV